VSECDRGNSKGRPRYNRDINLKKKKIKAGSGHWINNVTNISDQRVSRVVYEDSFKNNVSRRLRVVVICEGRIPTIFRV